MISRVVFYVIMEINMSKAIDLSANCDYIYQGGLYIITAILEFIVIITLIFMTFIVRNYVSGESYFY